MARVQPLMVAERIRHTVDATAACGGIVVKVSPAPEELEE
jgi:hypothetical protein